MAARITRREFLKLAGASAAASLFYRAGALRFYSTDGINPSILSPRVGAQGLAPLLSGPFRQIERGSGNFQPLDWEDAIARVAGALRGASSGQVAFLLGLFPDHLHHLAQQIGRDLGGARLLRYDPRCDMEGQAALADAARKVFGSPSLPVFDPAGADLIFSFGASFTETWLSRYAGDPGSPDHWRRKLPERWDGYWVQFEARRSPAAEAADEWIPIRPGSEAILARALAGLAPGADVRMRPAPDLEEPAAQTGIPAGELRRLASLFGRSQRRLALPGGAALSGPDGPAAAEWILALNVPASNPGEDRALYLAPGSPLHLQASSRPATAAELAALVEQMRSGSVKALFVHGVDLPACLPKASGLRKALAGVETVVSFSPYLDASAKWADFLLPDHAPGEAWGYQILPAEADLGRVAAILPKTPPRHNTRASVDVLLSLGKMLGLETAAAYQDEQDFLRCSLAGLANQGGTYTAGDPAEFYRLWQAHGGWQRARPARFAPVPTPLARRLSAPSLFNDPESDFRLLIYPVCDGLSGSLKAEIHPDAAAQRGLADGDLARLISPAGEMRLPVRLNPGLHPGAIAIGWNPAAGEGPDLLDWIGGAQNAAGGRVYSGSAVRIERLG